MASAQDVGTEDGTQRYVIMCVVYYMLSVKREYAEIYSSKLLQIIIHNTEIALLYGTHIHIQKANQSLCLLFFFFFFLVIQFSVELTGVCFTLSSVSSKDLLPLLCLFRR